MIAAKGLEAWHRVATTGDATGLNDLLDDDAVFHSPVVHTPQKGKAVVFQYLASATQVFKDADFKYLREIVQGDTAILEFSATLDGIEINGVDMIKWNEAGKIVDFKVMVRPLKAVNMLHQKMMAMLDTMAR
jgi:ketosteroid isomerase-like protein